MAETERKSLERDAPTHPFTAHAPHDEHKFATPTAGQAHAIFQQDLEPWLDTLRH